ncbi:regulatory protein RecX [Mariprofundus sp. EBB-1]|nr:regulatory protein RecX [Mariprofundus sp. EBB-1]
MAQREYCTLQIEQKLITRKIDHAIISVVIAQLKHDGYLSDRRFAESYLRSRLEKGETPWLAMKRAKQKGADDVSLQLAMDELTADYDVEQTARDLLAMRDPAGFRFEDERVWQRQARFLQNKGFGTDIVLRVLKERTEDSR